MSGSKFYDSYIYKKSNILFNRFNMKAFIILSFSFFFTITVQAQNYDVRKARWGMTINEVVSSEYPLVPSKSNEKEIRFDNIQILNNKATIIYEFSNKQLFEVRYIIYGANDSGKRGSCDKIISLYDKVNYTSTIFEAIKSKNYKCNLGWYLNCESNNYPLGYGNCNLDKKSINAMENFAFEKNCTEIILSFENERTNLSISFNQYQNSKLKYNTFPCNDEYYNTYYWVVFTPNYKTENEIRKSEF